MAPEKRRDVVVSVPYTRAEFTRLCTRAKIAGMRVRPFIRAITECKGPLPGI